MKKSSLAMAFLFLHRGIRHRHAAYTYTEIQFRRPHLEKRRIPKGNRYRKLHSEHRVHRSHGGKGVQNIKIDRAQGRFLKAEICRPCTLQKGAHRSRAEQSRAPHARRRSDKTKIHGYVKRYKAQMIFELVVNFYI